MLSRIIVVTICLLVGAGTTVAQVQPTPAAESKELQFAFENTPWRDVIQYLADEAELALHVRDLPTGSFTYADPNKFTLDEAIDRVNLFLLSQGFTLVRRGNLLSVINLGDPRGIQQLEALAKLVTVEQLKELNPHEVVKCIFPLEDIDPEDAVEELTPLKLMTTPSVFNKTRRLMITDTVVKLRSVQAILNAFEPSALDNGLVMKNFALQHVDAEDILSVARPHLGLATGEMIGIDVSLSADLKGKNIFVTGVDDKVKLIEGLINSLDKADDALSTADGKAELKSHLVRGGNVETVYNVLQTLLSGKPARLSIDEASSSVVALASPEIQNEIAQTVAQLEASDADFEVIPLRNVDPYFAIRLLEEMLDLPDPYLIDSTEEGSGEPKVSAPKIDADPGNMRLFVRGKKHQIEQIKKIVAELDVNSSVGESNETRVLPLRGRQAERILLTAAKFWRQANPIILYPSVVAESQPSERVLATRDDSPKSTPPPASKPSVPRYLTDDPASKAPALHCQITSRGLLIQCEDVEALRKFESHLRTIAGPLGSTPSPPVVFYLKYARPDDAIRMLAEMLDGGEAAKEAEVGSLVNGYVGGAGSFLGSLVSSRQGMTTMTAGTITVVADSRLNRLIAQGTTSDIELIERYLKIVDKDRSITAVETYGTSQVIELKHAKAMEVAEAIREAYTSRVAKAPAAGGARSGQPQQRPGQPQQEAPQQLKEPAPITAELASKGGGEKRSGGANANAAVQRPGGAAATRDLEPKMTVAVHEASNSLIITAPEQLFKEVEALAMKLDQRNERVVEIIQPPNVIVFDALMQALADEANGDRPSNNRGSTNRAAPGNAPSTRAGTTPARNSNGRRPTEFQFQKPTER